MCVCTYRTQTHVLLSTFVWLGAPQVHRDPGSYYLWPSRGVRGIRCSNLEKQG